MSDDFSSFALSLLNSILLASSAFHHIFSLMFSLNLSRFSTCIENPSDATARHTDDNAVYFRSKNKKICAIIVI